MTLLEISALYDSSAAAIRTRIRQLEAMERRQTDPEALRLLRLRIAALAPMLREMREMTFITAHYYDR